MDLQDPLHVGKGISMFKRIKSKKAIAVISLAALISVAGISACSSSDSKTGMEKTSIVLDWTPNTNHTGIYVAEKLGYYKEAGLNVEIKGYPQAGVEAVLGNNGADFGISGLDLVAKANAAGSKLKMVYNLQQKSSSVAVFRPDSAIKAPKDLDGKTLAAWGATDTGLRIRQMIINDGGKGDFKKVVVGIGAYEAVAQKRADFAEGLSTWESLEYELRGTPFKQFYPQDYGVTTSPCTFGIATSDELIKKNPKLVKNFIQATMKGYNYAVKHPDEAGKILVEMAPEAKLNPELVKRSQEMLSKDFWPDSRGGTGMADMQKWQEYLNYLAETKQLQDPNGKPLTVPLKADTQVTNEFVK